MLGATVGLACAAAAPARADLIQNGNFSNTTATTSYNGATVGTNTTDSNLAGWQFTGCSSSNCGFSFLATGNLATNGWYDGIDGHESYANTSPGTIPGSGNAFLSDATYQTQAIYQAVGGLKIGDTYTLAFSQASFQQQGYSGAGSPAAGRWGSATAATPRRITARSNRRAWSSPRVARRAGRSRR